MALVKIKFIVFKTYGKTIQSKFVIHLLVRRYPYLHHNYRFLRLAYRPLRRLCKNHLSQRRHLRSNVVHQFLSASEMTKLSMKKRSW